jgi:N6-adenosine-specific RNA methylase IME4
MQLDRSALRALPRPLQIEIEENVQRKEWTQSETAVVQRRLLEIVRSQAQPGRRTDLTAENAFSAVRDRATAVVGRLFGESHKQVEKRLDILNKATQDPARYGHLVDLMDRTDRVDAAHIELRLLERQQEHAQRVQHGCRVTDLSALPGQHYRVVLADPAWDDGGEGNRSAASHYPTMSLQQIADLPVGRLLAHDAALLMWVPGHHLARGDHVPVIKAWGLEPISIGFIWKKLNRSRSGVHTGLGWFTRHGTEICLLAIKGRPPRLANDVHELVEAPVGEHSAKPEEVRCRIERVFPGPRLELFARRHPVDGWDTWGNEIPPSQMLHGMEQGGA